jgi:hypothetical protein
VSVWSVIADDLGVVTRRLPAGVIIRVPQLIQRRDDSRRQARRTATLEQLDHCVKVDPGIVRELPGDRARDPSAQQVAAAPVAEVSIRRGSQKALNHQRAPARI